ncbi:MAG: DGQHR domain-containing protein [Bacilli bacterium]|nr:DGQHR domain-containing protein [Bacilli bacterium]MBR1582012.1 DGQHR domain-containing protein [Bacilli bacterium]
MATNWDDLVSGEELLKATKKRKNKFIEQKVSADKIDEFINKGWEVFKEYKNGSALVKKEKSVGDLFENEVWLIFQKMGFKVMNATNKFKLDYSDVSSKQIDIIAIDDEICLLIECKATEKEDNTKTWKTELESINGNFKGLSNEVRKKYPKVRVKYIFATKNFVIGDADIKRMEDFRIANFDYEKVRYYNDLSDHLGSAARYQLLGNLFAKTEIKGMNSSVPAIEGKMGNKTYYTFLIEPERLLKLAYILHRNKANHKLMPTYQRLIKKDRLKAIRKFVNEGGYFPNSLIVSIDTNGRGVVFEPSSTRTDNNLSRMGTLKLPKTYQSLYVIDGQHRLYGYSDSKFASCNSVPVVAFVDMQKHEQVKLFMDINENQKSVPKGLRNTLNIDLLWNAELYAQRQEALRLDLGQQLGEDTKSPLYGRVVTGEDLSNTKRCITLDYINDAFKQSNFFNIYKKGKNEILTPGTFDKTDNDETEAILFPFISKCFKTIKDYCSEERDRGSEGFLTINNTTFALIKVFNDIVNIQLKKENKVIVDDGDSFFKECEGMLLNLADTINTLDLDTINAIKTAKGGAAKKTSWNKLRVAFNTKFPDFTYPELEEYVKENCVNNNPYASQYIGEILDEIKRRLKDKIGNDSQWMHKYLPEKLRNDLISKVAIEKVNRQIQGNDEEVDEWDYISFNEIKQIANYGTNWSAFCSDVLVLPSNKMNKINTLQWLTDLESAKNRISLNQSIVTSEFESIKKIYSEFIKDENGEAI